VYRKRVDMRLLIEFADGEQGNEDRNLQWMVGGQSKWKTEWKPEVWHNIAYEIVRVLSDSYPGSKLMMKQDFGGQTVSFWHSTAAEPLKQTAGPFKASTNSVRRS